MKSLRKATGIILALAVVLCACVIAASAAEKRDDYKNEYPFVFVHGFNGWGGAEGLNGLIPYWGATTGDLMAYLQSEGYDCYSASVGPISSAWDRACELYAQLTGTTVDYGAAHSAEHNHKRYGRTYDEPLFEGWGQKSIDGKTKKINLIGHSFGGTTIRLFTYLMTYGCKEEVKAAGKDVSPLFTGGKERFIESVTTICTPHNSSSIYKFTEETGVYDLTLFLSTIYCSVLGRSPLNGVMVDFHLEQFGITNTPGEYDADLYFRSIVNFLKNSDDTCENNLLPENAQKMNDMIEISPDVYYFSYAFDATHKSSLTGLTWPDTGTNPVIAPLGTWMGHRLEFTNEETGVTYGDEWRPNDMLVNTISETYPFDEPHTGFDGTGTPQKGIWNVMPVQRGDHGQAIGLLSDTKETREFYKTLAEMLCKLK